jgi:hypothetical protein
LIKELKDGGGYIEISMQMFDNLRSQGSGGSYQPPAVLLGSAYSRHLMSFPELVPNGEYEIRCGSYRQCVDRPHNLAYDLISVVNKETHGKLGIVSTFSKQKRATSCNTYVLSVL